MLTPHIDRAMRAFEALDYGGVIINDVPTFGVDNFPYGGTKDSGHGREGVRFAACEMTEPLGARDSPPRLLGASPLSSGLRCVRSPGPPLR